MAYKDPAARAANHLAYRQKKKQLQYEYLSTHPCVDCGEDDPIVLEFDHVRGEKSFNVGTAISGGHMSWAKILTEIEKCDVRCANCHRRRTILSDPNQYVFYKQNHPASIA